MYSKETYFYFTSKTASIYFIFLKEDEAFHWTKESTPMSKETAKSMVQAKVSARWVNSFMDWMHSQWNIERVYSDFRWERK